MVFTIDIFPYFGHRFLVLDEEEISEQYFKQATE